ncbi:MAG: LLM class flavin-dependent oxidoreductase [Alphaproteobacteria bacterium]|jgi:alkanesulfonate monooxygenase SsuD/methylene tetrahydromethanopterin reductase-like flavin-dependent oxidoreductase (luciferase family)|nr:LLM class flavin-dependent oxidoreductase [Alphaproteobacteria bacterium]
MHFGQFNLMGHRERGTQAARLYAEATEQVKLAEAAGFEIAWFAEHHFSNYCTCPSPLMMVAHAAAVTERIRLGPAIVVVPLYNPLRLISELGQADNLCNGRLVLGMGSGYQPFEFDRLGADLDVSKPQTEEFMEMMEQAFANESFAFDGEFYQMPETHIACRPVQPNPEVWVAGDAALLHRVCAQRGHIPMFTGRLFGADYIAHQRDRLAESYRAEGKDPDAMRFGVQRYLCICDSREEALEYAEHCRHQSRIANNLRNGIEVVENGFVIEQPMENEPTLEAMVDNLLVGDAETVAERLTEEIRRARPHHVMFHTQVGASDFKQAMRSIEKFATEVRPLIEKELGPLEDYETRAAPAAAE